MFKRTISVGSPEEIQQQLAEFVSDLGRSNLPAPSAAYLREQVELTLGQFGRHFEPSGIKNYNADRVFEGEGFKVIVKIRGRAPGVLDKLKKVLGVG